MKNLSFYIKLINYFLLIIFIPVILLGQDTADFKWKIYNNEELRFNISIPESSGITYIESNHFGLLIPKRQISQSLDRQEMEIFVFKSDSCCTNSNLAHRNFGVPDNMEAIKEVIFGNRTFYLEEFYDHAMGGRESLTRYYTTCRTIDNTCFIFYVQLFYKYPYDEKTEGWGKLDFDIEKEFEYTYRILSSLDFPEMR